jgi:hypothetical protein
MPITYGVEIECYVPRNIGQQGVADALRALGVNAQTAAYSGRAYDRWQIKTDCSLSRAPHGYTGIEVVSPILTWDDDASADQVRLVSEYLVGIDAQVNATCGGHVHVSVGHLTAHGLANLVESYYSNLGPIGEGIAASRRNGTGYASFNRSIDRAISDIRSGGTRYAGSIGYHSNVINADWYSQRGTLEFRQREGSVNHYKIMGWVGFIVALIREADDRAEAGTLHAETFTTADQMTAYLIEGGYLTEVLRDWFLKRSVPRITSAVTERLQEARAAARVRVSRLMNLQGVR